MIECVGVNNCIDFFPYNPLKEQFQLRHKICIRELGWRDGLTAHDGTEADDFDKPGTRYLVKRSNETGNILGVNRLFPTVDELTNKNEVGRFMISNSFQDLVDNEIPSGPHIFEASRMVVCPSLRLRKELRRSVVNELVIAYMEYGIQENISSYVALMNPHYWKVFERLGWDVDYLGPEKDIGGGDVVRVGRLWISIKTYKAICKSAGIGESILYYGVRPEKRLQQMQNVGIKSVPHPLDYTDNKVKGSEPSFVGDLRNRMNKHKERRLG